MKPEKTEKKVTLAGKKITVKKLPLRKVVELLKSFSLPQEEIDKITASGNMPMQIAMGIETFAPIIADSLDKQVTAEELLNAFPEEILDLLTTIVEVNNLVEVFEKLKKGLALVQPRAAM